MLRKAMIQGALFALMALLPISAAGQTTTEVCTGCARVSLRSPQYLVKVYVVQDTEKPLESSSTGSGELVRGSDGVVRILTNYHVVEDAQNVWVHFDGEPFAQKVAVLGRDPRVDLALLEAPKPLPARARPIPIAQREVAVGDVVYALGFPSENRSVTPGFVASMSAPTGMDDKDLYFSHVASIAPGSSGGPLVRLNSKGEEELVGINTSVLMHEDKKKEQISNFGFSIRASVITRMLPKLEAERVVAHAFMGIHLADMNLVNPFLYEHLTKSSYPPERPGVMVLAVMPSGPTGRAGLLPGDIIREGELFLEGKWSAFPFSSAAQLSEEVFFNVPVGTKMRLKTERGKQKISREFELVEYPVRPKNAGPH